MNINTKIAEEVMKWVLQNFGTSTSPNFYWVDASDKRFYPKSGWNPSTDIACAWEVLGVIQTAWSVKQQLLFQAALIEEFDWNDSRWWDYKSEEVARKICNAALEVRQFYSQLK